MVNLAARSTLERFEDPKLAHAAAMEETDKCLVPPAVVRCDEGCECPVRFFDRLEWTADEVRCLVDVHAVDGRAVDADAV